MKERTKQPNYMEEESKSNHSSLSRGDRFSSIKKKGGAQKKGGSKKKGSKKRDYDSYSESDEGVND